VEAGVSFSRISPPAAGESNSMSPGLLAGVYFLVPWFSTIAIQPEIVYAQKYSRLTRTTGSTVQTTDVRLDYVEIPILAKLALIKGSYMLEGLAFGLPIRAKIRPATGAEQDIKSHVTSPDIGLVIGGGVPIHKVAIEGRYEGGFRKVDTAAGASIQRNRSFSMLVRLAF
jgi:hypothetical protein